MQGVLTGSHKARFKHIFFFQPRKTLKKQAYFHRYQISVADSQIPRNEDNIYSYSKLHLTDEAI